MLHVGRLLIAHLLHGLLVLLPTLILVGIEAFDIATVCFALGLTAAAVAESLVVPREFHVNSATIHDKVAMRVAAVVGLSLLGIFWAAQIEALGSARNLSTLNLLGASTLICGVVLRCVAIRSLGPRFMSDIQVDGTMVRDGIYAWLRHPSEIGLILIAVGGPLLIGAPITAAVAVLTLLPISLWRMHRENVAFMTMLRAR